MSELQQAFWEMDFYGFTLLHDVLSGDEVQTMRAHYDPRGIIVNDPDLARTVELLQSGHFDLGEPKVFEPIIESMVSPHDPWMTVADFRSYVNAQSEVATAYQDRDRWVRMSILNTAHSGKFSTDRTMREYNDGIWHLKAVPPLPLE